MAKSKYPPSPRNVDAGHRQGKEERKAQSEDSLGSVREESLGQETPNSTGAKLRQPPGADHARRIRGPASIQNARQLPADGVAMANYCAEARHALSTQIRHLPDYSCRHLFHFAIFRFAFLGINMAGTELFVSKQQIMRRAFACLQFATIETMHGRTNKVGNMSPS